MAKSNSSKNFISHIIHNFPLKKKFLALLLITLGFLSCSSTPNHTVAAKAFQVQQLREVIHSNSNKMLLIDKEIFMNEYQFNKKLCEDILDYSIYYYLPLKDSSFSEYLVNTYENYAYLIHKYKF